MGNVLNVLAPAPPGPGTFVLDEESQPRSAWKTFLAKVRDPLLSRIAQRRGRAADVCAALGAGGGSATATGGFSALHLACASGWDEVVTLILEAGKIDINATSTEGYTPLHVASMCGHAAAVRTLLEHGASLQQRSHRGTTALHFAAQCPESQAALGVLLGHPTCNQGLVNQRGFRQRSPLLLAVLAHGDAGVVRNLCDAGANPSERCTHMASISVLHTCAHLARVEAMRVLIEAGAQVDSLADDGISVLQEVFVQPPSGQRPEADKRQMFQMLVGAGASVNAIVPDKAYTVLHFAMASCREEETANLVADSGVDLRIGVNKPVLLGDASAKHTLLHLAAVRGWTRMAERLVAAGADLRQRNKDCLQPLHSAILGNQPETVATLLRLGADPLATSPDCYPSYASWKVQRGLRAMRAVMQADAGDAAMPSLMSLLDSNPQLGPQLTAVDLACCVARYIPTVEAFVARGVRPSRHALQLAEHAVPIMRAVVERPLWTPELHAKLPASFRAAARELLLCLSRPTLSEDGQPVSLTPDAVAAVLQQAAFPVSDWADAAWLAAQQVRKPLRQPAPPMQHAAAPGAAAVASAGPLGQMPQQQHPGIAAAGVGPAAHLMPDDGDGQGVPAFVQAVMQQVHQQLGAVAGGEPQMIIMHQHQLPDQQQQGDGIGQQAGNQHAQQGGNQPAGMAAMLQEQVAAAGAGGAPGAPAGVQLLQHQQLNNGNLQFHVMQFAVPIPGAQVPPAPAATAAIPALHAAAHGLAGPLPPAMLAGGLPPGLLHLMQQMLAAGGGGDGAFHFAFGEDGDGADEFDDADEGGDEEEEEGDGGGQEGEWADAVDHQQEHQPPSPLPAAAALHQPGSGSDGAGPSRQLVDKQATQHADADSSKRPASGSSRYHLRTNDRDKRQRQD